LPQRIRADTIKKQEANKKEAEDKVAYLLQQLRSAEMKINRMETLAARGESKQRLSYLEDTPSQTSPTAAAAFATIAIDRKEVSKMSDRDLSGSVVNSHSPRNSPDGACTPIAMSSSPRQAVSPRPAPTTVAEKEVPVPAAKLVAAPAAAVEASKPAPGAAGDRTSSKPAPGAAGDRTSFNKYTAFVSGA
jgi:hypothetical protein